MSHSVSVPRCISLLGVGQTDAKESSFYGAIIHLQNSTASLSEYEISGSPKLTNNM